MSNAAPFDFGVVGGGPAGLAAALSLARTGLRTALIGPAPTGSDNRTAALFTGSVRLLRNLGAWDLCRGTEPLTAIRIVDDMGALLRAPEVLFTAAEVGLDAFGYNVANADLVDALRRRAGATETIELIEDTVTRIEIDAHHVRLHLGADRSLRVRLLVGADGRNSSCRSAAGITTRTWRYEQSALTCTFAHQRPHGGVSTEFHRPAGPLTVVPAPGRASSLVWVERPAIARHLAHLDEAAFRATLELRLQGLLGPIEEMGPRAVFPLSGLTADVAGRNRVALVGEAAHVIPPIGAQGLNLGLRDAAVLADCVEDALRAGRDTGAPETLSAYARARSADIASRAFAIDLLNRSLISGMLPVGLARGIGLHALKAIGPLRRLAIREGLSPSFATPRLMQAPDRPFPLDAERPPLASPRN
jgi:2-octaprenyl-6-methoxyphenol hydroxylase